MKKPQSKSARIRKMLEQGKSVKQITAMVHCSPQQVYQIRAADKKKVVKVIQKRERDAMMNASPLLNQAPYTMVEVSQNYFQQKPSLWHRVKSFLGA